MRNQTGSGDHGGRHAIANEQNDVLSATLPGDIAHRPSRLGLSAIVVREGSHILAWLSQGDLAEGLSGDLNKRRSASFPGKQIFKPREIPSLDPRLRLAEEGRCGLSSSSLPAYGEGEVLVRHTRNGGRSLRTIDRRVHLESDVEECSWKQVHSVMIALSALSPSIHDVSRAG